MRRLLIGLGLLVVGVLPIQGVLWLVESSTRQTLTTGGSQQDQVALCAEDHKHCVRVPWGTFWTSRMYDYGILRLGGHEWWFESGRIMPEGVLLALIGRAWRGTPGYNLGDPVINDPSGSFRVAADGSLVSNGEGPRLRIIPTIDYRVLVRPIGSGGDLTELVRFVVVQGSSGKLKMLSQRASS